MFGIESILHPDRDILDAYGVDGRRINDFCTEVAELHRLDIREFVDGVSRLDDSRVSRHEPIYIGPNLQHVGTERRSNDAGCIVASSTS